MTCRKHHASMKELKSIVHRYEGVHAAKTVKKPRGKGATPAAAAKVCGTANAAKVRGTAKAATARGTANVRGTATAAEVRLPDEPKPPVGSRMPEQSPGRKNTVTREDVIEQLWHLATLPASETKDNINGQVRAATALAEVLGMKLPRPAGLGREFEGRSSEEQEFFAVHGYWPEQPVGAAEPGAAGVAAAGPPARQPQ